MTKIRSSTERCESIDDPSVQELRDALRVAVPVEDSDVVQNRRQVLVATIAAEIENLPTRRKREEHKQKVRFALRYLGAAAVLVATLGLGMLLTPDGGKEPSPQGRVGTTLVEASPGSGSMLLSKSQERLFELPGHTRLSMLRDSRIALIDDSILSQVMRLEEGGVLVTVPPADGKTHRSVSVFTPHARVKVKGTQFSVDLVEREGSSTGSERLTRVSVTRGVVEVSHANGIKILRAGESWTSTPGALFDLEKITATASATAVQKTDAEGISGPVETDQAPVDAPMKAAVAPTKAAPSQSQKKSKVTTPAEKGSTLAMQNALLESALIAADSRDFQKALELTGRLLQDYPDSPLRVSAQAVRRRVEKEASQL